MRCGRCSGCEASRRSPTTRRRGSSGPRSRRRSSSRGRVGVGVAWSTCRGRGWRATRGRLSGGGASGLRHLLDRAPSTLSSLATRIGCVRDDRCRRGHAGDGCAFLRAWRAERHVPVRCCWAMRFATGWVRAIRCSVFPYANPPEYRQRMLDQGTLRRLLACANDLGARATFAGSTYFREGRPWYEWHQLHSVIRRSSH